MIKCVFRSDFLPMIYFRRFSGLYSIDLFAAIAGARRPDGQYSSTGMYWMVVLSMFVLDGYTGWLCSVWLCTLCTLSLYRTLTQSCFTVIAVSVKYSSSIRF